MQSKKPTYKRWLWLILWVFLVSAVYWAWTKGFQPNNDQPTHLTAQVVRGSIESLVTATGTLQPKDYVDVGAQVSGQVKRLLVDVGDQVKAGDLLAEIDPTVFLAKVDESRAQLRYQKAQLKERKAQLKLAQVNFNRQKALFEKQATTEDALLTAEANWLTTQAQIEMIQAQIDQTESGLRADEANLQYAHIYAPMDGTVVSVTAKQGQTLNANQQAPIILQIADLSTMTVKTQVSEADVSKLKPGMAVYFTTLGSGQKRWRGVLQKVEPTPEVLNNVVLYNALFDIPNPKNRLMSQMTAQVFFIVDAANDTLLIPASALSKPLRKARSNANEVQVLVNGQPQTRAIKTGVSNRIQVEVTSGLKEGETVILQNAKNGQSQSNRTPGQRRPSLGFR